MTTAQVNPYEPQSQLPEERLERGLEERRTKLQLMYLMLANMERGIVGEGFSISRVPDPNGEYFKVYRRGFGTENAKSLTRVATMFTPEMFIEGIPAEGCPALPGNPACANQSTIDR